MTNNSLITIIDRFARFQNECADAFIETAELHRPHDANLVAICADQFNFMAGRSKAVIELIKMNLLWDAQILARPIIESCVKLCFLCFSPSESRAELCNEYQHILATVNALKLHDKAVKTLEATGGAGHPTLDGLILSDEKLRALKDNIPKEVRKEVESRWGFTRMVVILDQLFQSHFQIRPFAGFFHTYGVSSHLVHADEMGLGTMRARKELNGPQLSVIENSHQLALLDVAAGSAMISALSIAWASEKNLDKAIHLFTTYALVEDGTY